MVRVLLKDGKNFRGLFFSIPCRIDRVGKSLHLAMQLKDRVKLCRYEDDLKSAIWEMTSPEDFQDFVELPQILDDPGLFMDFSLVPVEWRSRMAEELKKGTQTCFGFLVVQKKARPRATGGRGRPAEGRRDFSPDFASRFPGAVGARRS
jgi:hypothetical protein